MDEIEHPQIYLITPPELDLAVFPSILAQCLDAVDVACVRLALATKDEGDIARAADACRVICHERDVALVIDNHIQQVDRLGLDGVHLTDGARSVRSTRKELRAEAIIGTYCEGSRHDGLSAGEGGADYVAFGPVAATTLGDGSFAEKELFQWWSEMIEVPVVAEGALDIAHIRLLAPHVDFFGIGSEIWKSDTPSAALLELQKAITG